MSSVRAAVLETPVFPAPTGDMAYRAVFSREQLEGLNDDHVNELCQRVGVTSWLGPEKHTVFYPVRGGQEFNLVLLRPDNLSSGARKEQGDIDEMRASYADWDPTWVLQKIFLCIIVKSLLAKSCSLLASLQKIISCVPSVYKWKLTHLPELESWTKVGSSSYQLCLKRLTWFVQGSVALLGDACHPTLPYQAQGAAMAVEDGAVVGKLLGSLQAQILNSSSSGNEPSQSTKSSAQKLTAEVLALYEKNRKARTTRNVQGAIKNRQLFHMPDGILQNIRDFVLSYAGVTRKSDWTWVLSSRQSQVYSFDVLEDCGKDFEAWRLSIEQDK